MRRLSFFSMAALVGAALSLGAREPARIVFTQLPLHDGGAAGLPDGSRIALFDPAVPDAGVRNLTPGFVAAGRPDLSFDGTRILFVARTAADDVLDVWETDLDGGTPRQITHGDQDCVQAIYLSTLYTLDASAPERRIAYCVDDGAQRGPGVACAALYTSRMDGSEKRAITFNPYGVGDPYLLGDGRLLYVGARPPESGGGSALFTVHPDGTDVSAFAAAHAPPAIRGMPTELGDDSVVFVEADLAGAKVGGALIAVSRSRSLHGRRVLAGGDDGVYRAPSEASDGRMLVSYRPAEGGTYGIYVLDPLGVEGRDVLFDAPDRHDVDALAVRRREPPPGRSSVVEQGSSHGYLYCMDAYLSDRERAREIAKGSIASLRVFAAPANGQTAGLRGAGRLLAEVPVRPDGSFYLQLPARTPLRLETTDAAGESLQAMESWIWVMPNEQRGCIGCHEDRERTPPNLHPLALRAQPQVVDGDRPSGEGVAGPPASGGQPE